MAILDIRQRVGYLFGAVTVGHIILISAQVTTDRGVPMLEAVTFGVFAEVQRGASSLIGGIRASWGDYLALRSVRSENERLQQEIGQLHVTLQQERALAQQSRTLQALLDLRSQAPLTTAAAGVIASSASPDFRTITIDKGTEDGLRPDMAVIAPAGVVGRVITPSARAAKVQLLIDRNAAAGALVERSRAQGVIEGTGADLRLNYVSATADVIVGDVVVTSGIDGLYPKGFVIGQIESVERRGGAYGAIVVRPSVAFASLEALLVVLAPERPVPEAAAAQRSAESAPRARE
jgi:rod shape-determining protein MreC